jgi:hypothetical protein
VRIRPTHTKTIEVSIKNKSNSSKWNCQQENKMYGFRYIDPVGLSFFENGVSIGAAEVVEKLNSLRREYLDLKEENKKLKKDAERWRALTSLDRIRILGTARLGKERQHIGLELWEFHSPTSTQASAKERLTTFIDTAIKNKSSNTSSSIGSEE